MERRTKSPVETGVPATASSYCLLEQTLIQEAGSPGALALGSSQGETIISSKRVSPASFSYIDKNFSKAHVHAYFEEVPTKESIEIVSRGKGKIRFTSDLSPSRQGILNVPIRELQTGFDLVLAWNPDNENSYIREFLKAVKNDLHRKL